LRKGLLADEIEDQENKRNIQPIQSNAQAEAEVWQNVEDAEAERKNYFAQVIEAKKAAVPKPKAKKAKKVALDKKVKKAVKAAKAIKKDAKRAAKEKAQKAIANLKNKAGKKVKAKEESKDEKAEKKDTDKSKAKAKAKKAVNKLVKGNKKQASAIKKKAKNLKKKNKKDSSDEDSSSLSDEEGDGKYSHIPLNNRKLGEAEKQIEHVQSYWSDLMKNPAKRREYKRTLKNANDPSMGSDWRRQGHF
jgi:hypothetical protein